MVKIEKYNPKWKDQFIALKKMIIENIGDLILKVEHVGSTSVEGLAAKPIIDLDIVIEDNSKLPAVIKGLKKLGYIHQGNLGIEGREAFKKVSEDRFQNHHLYVCPQDGRGYLEHIALRDYLRNNKKARIEYGKLKRKLADKFPYQVEKYCNAKSKFIAQILAETIYDDKY